MFNYGYAPIFLVGTKNDDIPNLKVFFKFFALLESRFLGMKSTILQQDTTLYILKVLLN
jgi:hypothetical protein